MKSSLQCDVLVVGGGHAGAEAALASARMGLDTILVTTQIAAIARMPCNPSIGGLAKSHLVHELDAMGGEMGRNADSTALQAKILNRSRGPAVWATRTQCAKKEYTERMQAVIASQKNLRIVEDAAVGLVVEGERRETKDASVGEGERQEIRDARARQETKDAISLASPTSRLTSNVSARVSNFASHDLPDPPRVSSLVSHALPDAARVSRLASHALPAPRVCHGVVTASHGPIYARATVVTAGTTLRGRIWIGKDAEKSGGDGRPAVDLLSKSLEDHGFQLIRLKTGTPPRLKASSCDFTKCTEQPGETPRPMFHVEQSASRVSRLASPTSRLASNVSPRVSNFTSHDLPDAPRVCGLASHDLPTPRPEIAETGDNRAIGGEDTRQEIRDASGDARLKDASGDARPRDTSGDARPKDASGDARPRDASGDARPRDKEEMFHVEQSGGDYRFAETQRNGETEVSRLASRVSRPSDPSPRDRRSGR